MSSAAKALAPQAAPRASDGGARIAAPARALGPRLQRNCSCGGGCESCKKKAKESLQKKAATGAGLATKAPAAPKAAAPKAPTATAPTAQASTRAGALMKPAKPVLAIAKPAERERSATAGNVAPEVVRRVLDTAGQPLDPATRLKMESRFGRDFGGVRVHTDALAAESARAVSAHAYTVGQHIVFDAGLYRPATPDGRRLLAHELAHTVQQHGLPRSEEISMEMGCDYQHLERDADRVAGAVLARQSPGAPVASAHSGAPVLSRAKSSGPKPAAALDEAAEKRDEADSWVVVNTASALYAAGVEQLAKPTTDLVAVKMWKPMELPPEKGPEAMALWDAQAKAGALQAIMEPGSSQPKTRTGVKQDRPDTEILRDLWLRKMGWEKGTPAEQLWSDAAKKVGLVKPGQPATFRPTTQAGGTTCDIDHILELQFGGDNVVMNMQVLDSSPNRSSGSQISQDLKGIALEVQNALLKEPGAPQTRAAGIRLQYSSVKPKPGTVTSKCVAVEKAGVKGDVAGLAGAKKGTRFPMRSGALSGCVVAEDKKDPVVFADLPENKPVTSLIPGLLMKRWVRPKSEVGHDICVAGERQKVAGAPKAAGHVMAGNDPASRVLGVLQMGPNEEFKFARDSSGALVAPKGDPRIAFLVNFLSPGVIHKLDLQEDGSVAGKATIKPTVPFFPKSIDLEFDKDNFALIADITKPNIPIPGFKVTEAKVGLEIAPAFKPEGKVAFEVAPGGKRVLHGELTVSADASGLVVAGDVLATIPGVDEAKGHLQLKNKIWSGSVEIKAGDFGKSLKYVKNGQVSIRFEEGKPIQGLGSVDLQVPGVAEPVKASASYDGARGWTYRGKATFNPPKIKPVEIDLEYRDGHLSGEGRTGFEFNHLDGTIRVRYRDELFFGEGTLGIKTERAEGSLKVTMTPRPEAPPVFTGEGRLSYQVTPNLVAEAGIKIDEHQKVKIDGELTFPKPIHLMDGFHGDYEIFNVSMSIPIPGASIGGIGLNAVIGGALSAGYSIGPAELRDTKAKASFQPLEKNPELEMDMTSRLHMGAMARVTGSISGDIALDAKIASVRGGLTVAMTAKLEGGLDAPMHAHYKAGKIEADVDFHAMMALSLLLALSAHVRAEAGWGRLSVATGKEWTLAEFPYDPGLTVGMKLKKPIRYATGEGLALPTMDDIEWIKPKLNPEAATNSAFKAGDKGEHPV